MQRTRRSTAHLAIGLIQQALLYIVVTLGLLVFCIPVYYMVSTSFKAESEVFAMPIHWIPHQFRPSNYPEAFAAAPFARYFYNSVVVAIAVVLATLFFSALAGYGFAKFSFPGQRIAFLFVLSTMMIPFQVLLIPLYVVVYGLGWTNSYAGLIIPGAISAFNVILMKTFFAGLPNELEEAGRVDGLGVFGIFTRITLPLSKPILATITLFVIVGMWNNWFGPSLFLESKEKWPIALYLKQIINNAVSPTEIGASSEQASQIAASVKSTAMVLTSLPIICIYPFVQRYFVQGMMIGAVKG